MTVRFVTGDLLSPQVKEEAIAHGCNAIGRMGAGIAKKIKEMYPPCMFEDYKEACQENSLELTRIRPGQVSCAIYNKKYNVPILFNLITQEKIWKDKDGGPPARLEWIEEAFEAMISICKDKNIETVGMPMIGAGLGGLKHKDVKDLMIRVLGPVEHTEFVVYEFYEAHKETSLNYYF